MEKFGILILAGGLSSRMNYQPKALLNYQGKTFIQQSANTFTNYPNKYLSINPTQDLYLEDFGIVVDEYDNIGPMSGIVSAFHQTDLDQIFVCSCDMPLINTAFVQQLLNQLDDYDGIFIEDNDHIYMCAGIYTRKMLPELEKAIEEKNYRLYRIAKSCNTKFIRGDTSCLVNVNTIEDYEKLCKGTC